MFREEDHPRDKDGKFTDEARGDRQEKLANAKRIYNTEETNSPIRSAFPKHLTLPKQEYAKVCGSLRTKYTNQIPKNGQILYGDNYYRFKYDLETEKIVFTFKVKIEGNEEQIAYYMEEFENE